MDALISVIIPIYNVEAYLERCLDSVINNTYRNLEIICVNDGSPDNCQAILERYAAQDDRVKVIYQENRGLSAARNTGMDAATGDYIYFLDSDDWIHHESFRFLLQAAEESGAGIVACGFKTVHCEAEYDPDAYIGYPEKLGVMTVAKACQSGYMRDEACSKLWCRSLIESHRFPVGIRMYGEDAFFNMLVACYHDDKMYAKIDLPLYAYYLRQGSIMRTVTLDTRMKSIKYWAVHLADFKKPEYAVSWVSQQIFYYKLHGKYCITPRTARKNARMVWRLCLPYLWDCRKLCRKLKIKMVMNTFFPSLYYAIIKYRDPTWKIHEEGLKKQNKNVTLTRWEDL